MSTQWEAVTLHLSAWFYPRHYSARIDWIWYGGGIYIKSCRV